MTQADGSNTAKTSGVDGEINRYVSYEARAEAWFDRNREVIFVNGMANKMHDHDASAYALSLVQGCAVVGIYNKTNGGWIDFGQCLRDKATLVSAQSGAFLVWKAAVDAAYIMALLNNPMLSKVNFVGTLIAANAATLSLYKLLTGSTEAKRKGARIYAHSQGNLITANALTAVALALGSDAIRGIEVNCFGSPAHFWPSGLNRTNHAFTFDPVSWLDFNIGFDSVKVGIVAGHGFELYMENDGKFVVNRFQWGTVLGTASMDEAGLANFCVKMGVNARRLLGVFRYLKAVHWTDSDDVAEIYVATMRRDKPTQMKALATMAPEFIKLLIRCLDDGYTASGEHSQIKYLQGLLLP